MQYHIISNDARCEVKKSPAGASFYTHLSRKDCQKSSARNYSASDKRRRMGYGICTAAGADGGEMKEHEDKSAAAY